MMTCSTSAPSTLDRSSTSLITAAPRSGALSVESPPPSLPNGVRPAATITTSSTKFILEALHPPAEIAHLYLATHDRCRSYRCRIRGRRPQRPDRYGARRGIRAVRRKTPPGTQAPRPAAAAVVARSGLRDRRRLAGAQR